MGTEGRTTTRANLRSGPGTETQVLRVLEPATPLSIVEDTGTWLRVETEGLQGFVHERLVARQADAVPPGLLAQPIQPEPFGNVPLEPAADQQIRPPAASGAAEKLVARTWNRLGRLLSAIAIPLKLDPGAAVAVFCVESAGNGFASDGRMIIRFENHHFFRYWGKDQRELFDAHFRFSGVKSWQGHLWRSRTDENFQKVHVNQASEWSAFECARGLDDTAAKLSISMGTPQIMGSNYADAGFESVQEMFDRFAQSERRQVVAFFDFLQGHETHPRKVIALQRRDFIRFAELYNGPGNAAEYGARIAQSFEAFQRLRPAGAAATA